MSMLDDVFKDSENWGDQTPEETPVATGGDDKAKAAKKAEDDKVKAAAEGILKQNPGLVEVLSTRSSDLEVTKVFCTFIIPNIKPDKSQPKNEKGKYPLVATSYKVGYEVRNVGSEPIQYMAPNYVLNPETGKYENQEHEATLAPGDTAILDRLHMTMLCARPEFSFGLRNGSIKKSSKQSIETKEELLRSYYFTFDREAVSFVSDDEVNQLVDEEVDGVKKIRDEFVPYFGYVMNTKEVKARAARKASKKTISSQEKQALFIMSVLQGQGGEQ